MSLVPADRFTSSAYTFRLNQATLEAAIDMSLSAFVENLQLRTRIVLNLDIILSRLRKEANY